MDFLPETVQLWLLSYGCWALFALLAIGIIALPVPEETLLIFSGVLISQDYLPPAPAFISAFLGSSLGITVSYFIGCTGGLYVIKKYGPYLGFSEKKLAKVNNWFEHYGKWFVFIGYFIPGLRHFSGICAGVSNLEYRNFALYAYSGALFWVALFLSLGYFFGNFYQESIAFIESHVELFVVTAALFVIALLFILRNFFALSPANNGK